MDGASRRTVLKLGSVALVSGITGCAGVSSTEPDATKSTSTSSTNTDKKDDSRSSSATKEELRAHIADLETRLETLKTDLDEKEERIRTLEAEVNAKEEQIRTLEDELNSLKVKLEQKDARAETLEEKVDEKDRRIAELERQIESDSETSESSQFSEKVRERARSVAEDVRKAVVYIRGDGNGGGTAWFLDDGYLITNSHVVDGQSNFECWTIDGETFSPELLGRSEYLRDPYDDVAVLETDFEPANELPLGPSNSLTDGQPVVQVGHPGLMGNWVVSLGKYVKDGYSDTVLTTVPSMQGNSGSPLVTLEGEVVGILSGEVRRDRSGSSGAPEPVELKLYEEFPDSTYSSHDTTSIIETYVEKFG